MFLHRDEDNPNSGLSKVNTAPASPSQSLNSQRKSFLNGWRRSVIVSTKDMNDIRSVLEEVRIGRITLYKSYLYRWNHNIEIQESSWFIG